MIKTMTQITSTHKTITHPSVVGVLKDLKNRLLLNAYEYVETMHTHIDYKKDNWNIGDKQLTGKHNPRTRFIRAEITDKVDTDNILTQRMYRSNDTTPVLYDKDIGFYIRPVNIDHNVEMNITILNKSINDLKQSINKMVTQAFIDERVYLHKLSYFYYLNPKIIDLIRHINELKNTQLTTPLTDEQYLESICDSRLTGVNTIAGLETDIEAGFKESQTAVKGIFQEELADKDFEHDKDSGFWSYTFSYKFMFNKPTYYEMQYPILVNNLQLKDEYLIKVDYNYELTKGLDYGLVDITDLFRISLYTKTFYQSTISPEANRDYFRYPTNDAMPSKMPSASSTILFVMLVSITDDNKRTLFSLKHMPHIELVPEVIMFLEDTEYEYLNLLFRSVFHIFITENSSRRHDALLTVDNDLNISATEDLDMTKSYRVYFEITLDIDILDTRAKTSVANNAYLMSPGTKIFQYKSDDEIQEHNKTVNTISIDPSGAAVLHN